MIKQEYGIDMYCEIPFAKPRKFSFDYGVPKYRIALEVEGAVFKERTYTNKKGILITTTGGRHNTADGFMTDMEKYNLAGVNGWIVLRCVPDTLFTTATLHMVRDAIETRSRIEPNVEPFAITVPE